VRHPHRQLVAGGHGPEQPRPALLDRQRRPTELALVGRRDLATEQAGHELRAVADAEHRHPELEQRRIDRRRALGIDRRRSAREDDGRRRQRPDLGQGQVERLDLAVHRLLAHPAGDELGDLRTKVEDQDELRAWIALRVSPIRQSGGRSCGDLRSPGL
jgi:hypothetical protein